MRHHFIYYLFAPRSGELLYIGRSIKPEQRLIAFQNRTGRAAVFGIHQRHCTLEAAQVAELKAIAKHRPPFNRYLTSSRGTLNQPIGKGRTLSAEHRANIGTGHLGNTISEVTRQKIRMKLMGHPVSELTRKKISAATQRDGAKRTNRRKYESHDFGGFAGGCVVTKTRAGSSISQH